MCIYIYIYIYMVGAAVWPGSATKLQRHTPFVLKIRILICEFKQRTFTNSFKYSLIL